MCCVTPVLHQRMEERKRLENLVDAEMLHKKILLAQRGFSFMNQVPDAMKMVFKDPVYERDALQRQLRTQVAKVTQIDAREGISSRDVLMFLLCTGGKQQSSNRFFGGLQGKVANLTNTYPDNRRKSNHLRCVHTDNLQPLPHPLPSWPCLMHFLRNALVSGRMGGSARQWHIRARRNGGSEGKLFMDLKRLMWRQDILWRDARMLAGRNGTLCMVLNGCPSCAFILMKEHKINL